MLPNQRYQKLLEELERRLRQIVSVREEPIQLSYEQFLTRKGKRIRPMLCFLSARLSGSKESPMSIALAAELLHNASLLHDDVIDEAHIRRDQPTTRSRYSNAYAIYSGDYLLTKVVQVLFEDHAISREQGRVMILAMQAMCRAEMIQYHYKYSFELSIRDLLKVIAGKTAILFSACLASMAQEDHQWLALAHFGLEMGMAFQIQDDAMDFFSEEKTIGKDTNNGIKQGYYNLPILLMYERDPKRTQELIRAKTLRIDDIRGEAKAMGIDERVHSMASSYLDRAKHLIHVHAKEWNEPELAEEMFHWIRDRDF